MTQKFFSWIYFWLRSFWTQIASRSTYGSRNANWPEQFRVWIWGWIKGWIFSSFWRRLRIGSTEFTESTGLNSQKLKLNWTDKFQRSSSSPWTRLDHQVKSPNQSTESMHRVKAPSAHKWIRKEGTHTNHQKWPRYSCCLTGQKATKGSQRISRRPFKGPENFSSSVGENKSAGSRRALH